MFGPSRGTGLITQIAAVAGRRPGLEVAPRQGQSLRAARWLFHHPYEEFTRLAETRLAQNVKLHQNSLNYFQ